VANPADKRHRILHYQRSQPTRTQMKIRETRRIAAAAQACAVALMAVFAFALGTLPGWPVLVAVCERLGAHTMAPGAAPGDSPQGEGRRSGQCATSIRRPSEESRCRSRRATPKASPLQVGATPVHAVAEDVMRAAGISAQDVVTRRSPQSELSVRCMVASGRGPTAQPETRTESPTGVATAQRGPWDGSRSPGTGARGSAVG
jgi:hypothetical protein